MLLLCHKIPREDGQSRISGKQIQSVLLDFCHELKSNFLWGRHGLMWNRNQTLTRVIQWHFEMNNFISADYFLVLIFFLAQKWFLGT